jgi:hypothetical protein
MLDEDEAAFFEPSSGDEAMVELLFQSTQHSLHLIDLRLLARDDSLA